MKRHRRQLRNFKSLHFPFSKTNIQYLTPSNWTWVWKCPELPRLELEVLYKNVNLEVQYVLKPSGKIEIAFKLCSFGPNKFHSVSLFSPILNHNNSMKTPASLLRAQSPKFQCRICPAACENADSWVPHPIGCAWGVVNTALKKKIPKVILVGSSWTFLQTAGHCQLSMSGSVSC